MEPAAANSLFNVNDTVFVPYEGGKHYAARVRRTLPRYARSPSTFSSAVESMQHTKTLASFYVSITTDFLFDYAQVSKKELRKYQHPDGSHKPMWHYLVHYMVRSKHVVCG